jgi:hypothetical protein
MHVTLNVNAANNSQKPIKLGLVIKIKIKLYRY